ncbi:MAG: hypothetical protein FJ311_02030 [Rhodospirillales bacterium]|nr:hypothetical protein [Rhodospirillales bacterium]
MNALLQTAKRQWPDVCNLLLGIWLIVSPWVLAYTNTQLAMWNAYILGAIIAIAAAAALIAFHEWEEWVSMALGIWLIVSPWVLGFATTKFTTEVGTLYSATWNFVFIGVFVVGLAGWTTWKAHHPGQTAT